LQTTRDGKEGVDGSSPSEGSAKAPHIGAFVVFVEIARVRGKRLGTGFGDRYGR
jgi:hypothetical protein